MIKIEPAPKTWWGALNSVPARVDHASKIKGDRYANRLFSAGDRLKSNAYSRARQEAMYGVVGMGLAWHDQLLLMDRVIMLGAWLRA